MTIQGSFIQQSIRDGSLVLYHDYRLGHARDLSSYGNHGTPSGDCWFSKDGFNNRYLGTGAILVNHSASINISTFTAVGFMASGRVVKGRSVLPQLARKQDGAGLSWSLRFNDLGPTVDLDAAGSAAWVFGRAFSGIRYVGCNLQSGTIATPLYADGVLADAALSVSPTIALNASALYIANIYLANRGLGTCLSSFLMWNRLLTATEHARLYGELMK